MEDPSNFCVIRRRYQARMVSGLPTCATCFSALRPSRLAISPNVTRSRIGKPQPHRQMASQNPILCDQVLVAQQQILIHEPRYERQEACPVESIRAWWNVDHNDGRSEIILRSSILTERELRDNAFFRPC
jgi:hypothetical protein